MQVEDDYSSSQEKYLVRWEDYSVMWLLCCDLVLFMLPSDSEL